MRWPRNPETRVSLGMLLGVLAGVVLGRVMGRNSIVWQLEHDAPLRRAWLQRLARLDGAWLGWDDAAGPAAKDPPP